MLIVRFNVTYVDNGYLVESYAESLHDPGAMTTPTPPPCRRIFHDYKDVKEFITSEMDTLTPENIEKALMAAVEPLQQEGTPYH